MCKVQVINFRDTGVPQLYAALHNLNSASSGPCYIRRETKNFSPAAENEQDSSMTKQFISKLNVFCLQQTERTYICDWVVHVSFSLLFAMRVPRAAVNIQIFCVQMLCPQKNMHMNKKYVASWDIFLQLTNQNELFQMQNE